MQTSYLSEFLTLAILHIAVLIGPGVNFTLVVKNSLTLPARFGFLTAFGIALGTVVYVALALFALSLLLVLTQSDVVFSALKLLGASYLVYIGVRSFTAKKKSGDIPGTSAQMLTDGEAIRMGLFSQLSNPKAVLFFISLFTQIVSAHTPLVIKIGYGVWMFTATFV